MTDYNELIERLERGALGYGHHLSVMHEAAAALRELQKAHEDAAREAFIAHMEVLNRAEAAELKVEQLQSVLNVANAGKNFFERRCKELNDEIEELYYPNRQ